LRTPSPADVLSWFLDSDRKIVAAPVTIGLSAGWATCDPIPANLAPHLDIIENAELAWRGAVIPLWHFRPSRLLNELNRDLLAGDEPLQFGFCHLAEPRKVSQLVGERVVGIVEPESPAAALLCTPVNAQRCTDCIAKFMGTDLILAREDFNSFWQAGTLNREPQSQGGVIDVDAAVSRESRLLEEDPQMAAAVRLLQRGFYSILGQFILKFQQVLDGVLVVGVDGDPLRPLSLRSEERRVGKECRSRWS